MQIDACILCGEPALDHYRLERLDTRRLAGEELRAPVCEPHRAWLAASGERGRTLPHGVRWRLLESG